MTVLIASSTQNFLDRPFDGYIGVAGLGRSCIRCGEGGDGSCLGSERL